MQADVSDTQGQPCRQLLGLHMGYMWVAIRYVQGKLCVKLLDLNRGSYLERYLGSYQGCIGAAMWTSMWDDISSAQWQLCRQLLGMFMGSCVGGYQDCTGSAMQSTIRDAQGWICRQMLWLYRSTIRTVKWKLCGWLLDLSRGDSLGGYVERYYGYVGGSYVGDYQGCTVPAMQGVIRAVQCQLGYEKNRKLVDPCGQVLIVQNEQGIRTPTIPEKSNTERKLLLYAIAIHQEPVIFFCFLFSSIGIELLALSFWHASEPTN